MAYIDERKVPVEEQANEGRHSGHCQKDDIYHTVRTPPSIVLNQVHVQVCQGVATQSG